MKHDAIPTEAIVRNIHHSLSLLVQGPIATGDIQPLTSAIVRYRKEFPSAAIIVAVSPSSGQTNEQLIDISRQLAEIADTVTIAERCPPLPPVKSGIGPNYFNQQRAAARAGLEHIKTAYTLRIRSDMLEIRREIVDHYAANAGRPRGPFPVLHQRVLIAPYFTLNPLTNERLCFHFSDWLHLGRTEDLRRIWTVPPYPEEYSDYYSPGLEDSKGSDETRKFRSRLAVEQHLYFSLLASAYPQLWLSHHSDHRSAIQSLQALADNFVIDDVHKSHAIPGKYANLLSDQSLEITCLTFEDWLHLAERSPALDIIDIFQVKIIASQEIKKRQLASERIPRSRAAGISVKAITFLAYIFSGNKSRQKLLESPGLYFYDIKSHPGKILSDLFFLCTRNC